MFRTSVITVSRWQLSLLCFEIYLLSLNTAFDIVFCCYDLPFTILTIQCALSCRYGYYCKYFLLLSMRLLVPGILVAATSMMSDDVYTINLHSYSMILWSIKRFCNWPFPLDLKHQNLPGPSWAWRPRPNRPIPSREMRRLNRTSVCFGRKFNPQISVMLSVESTSRSSSMSDSSPHVETPMGQGTATMQLENL